MITQTEPFLVATLPLPPSANNLYKNVPYRLANGRMTSRRAPTGEYLAFQRDAIAALKQADVQDQEAIVYLQESKRNGQFLALSLDIWCYVEHLWVRDEDNFVKPIQDMVFHVLGMKDNLVTDLSMKKRKATRTPHAFVRLSFAPLTGEDESWLR